MEQATREAIEAVVSKDIWTIEDHDELLKRMFAVNDAPGRFRELVARLEAANPEPKGGAALKIGIARYMLCRFAGALDMLAAATDNKERRYFAAMCHKSLRQYDKAAEELQRARDRGFDGDQIDLQLAELNALASELPTAEKALGALSGRLADNANFLYVRGLVDELSGRYEQAMSAYERARALAGSHGPATFRLAYCCDLHGDEERAMALYKECLAHPPVHANALLNLAVLYEDVGKYDQALHCARRVLACNPNHPRARLFAKDAEASRTMYYDEEQAKRMARRNAVLDIPVSDFELSVRARNCLKKMNVRTLGDLVRTTEAELLAYKNFGETSLKEIKDMLGSRNLRLGQSTEEGVDLMPIADAPEPLAANDGLLATPISQIEFSIRARKALDSLNVRTLGDLTAKSEAELLACRNFGQTSLNEVSQRLAEYGLQLREQG